MRKFVYTISNPNTGEDTGELEIEARDDNEAWDKARAAEKSGKYLKPGEFLSEWREVPQAPDGVKRH